MLILLIYVHGALHIYTDIKILDRSIRHPSYCQRQTLVFERHRKLIRVTTLKRSYANILVIMLVILYRRGSKPP